MKNPRNNTPMTLLDVIKKGYFQQVRYLVDQDIDVNQVDEDRRTALMLCSFIEPDIWGIGIARLLIENDANLDCRDRFGLSAFHYACIYERVDLVKVFLKAIDFDLTAGDKEGNTGLHYAVRAGNAILVRLIIQCYLKYKLSLEKENKKGLNPLGEAYRLGNKRCIKLLECPEMVADAGNLEFSLPLDLRTDLDDSMSFRSSSRKTYPRPQSSILSRRSSKSSTASTEMYFFRRSPTIYNYDTRKYKRAGSVEKDLPANVKNIQNLISCASLSDFRNNPEYLFHTSQQNGTERNGREPDNREEEADVKRHIRAKSAFVRRKEVENDYDPHSVFSWRTEFRKLFVHYQYQCSPSYRDSVPCQLDGFLPQLEKPMTPSPSEDGWDDDRNRKGRRSVSRQNTKEVLHGGKGKPPIPSKSRKVGSVHSRLGVDPALESSSESINSSVSSKKHTDEKSGKGTKDKKEEPAAGGRASRTSTHKTGSHGTEVTSQDHSQQDGPRLRVISEAE